MNADLRRIHNALFALPTPQARYVAIGMVRMAAEKPCPGGEEKDGNGEHYDDWLKSLFIATDRCQH
jgi:hypothetical protein